MPSPAELSGDFVDVHGLAFRTQTDAGEFRFQLFKHAGDDDRGDSTDVIDQALGIAAFSSGAREIGFLKPEPGNLILVREAKMTIDVPQQTGAGKRVGLINFVTDFCQVGATLDEFTRDMVGAGTGGGVLKRTGVG